MTDLTPITAMALLNLIIAYDDGRVIEDPSTGRSYCRGYGEDADGSTLLDHLPLAVLTADLMNFRVKPTTVTLTVYRSTVDGSLAHTLTDSSGTEVRRRPPTPGPFDRVLEQTLRLDMET